MTGKPGLCIGTLGPGMANMAGAIQCALVENSPVIFLGGQRARITERRVRRRVHQNGQPMAHGRGPTEIGRLVMRNVTWGVLLR